MASESGSSESEGEPPALSASPTPFEKISWLGEGAFGAVWLARCRSSDRYVALKEVARHVADPVLLGPERDVLKEISRARAEAQAARVSPALAGLVSTFVTPFAICMAMDLVEGTHLQDHLRAGQMKEDRVKWYVAELACALDWLHQAGWLYRDLKLTNVMLSLSHGSYGRVKLIDFGFAIHAPWSNKAVGTLETMAPEVISCSNAQWPEDLGVEFPKGYGPTADWWSLGVVLFELLTGDAPFGRHDDILLEGQKVLSAQVTGLPWHGYAASDEAKVAASQLCQLKPSDRPNLHSLKQLTFFGPLDWQLVMSTEAAGPSFEPLGFTIASASEERLRPRRGAAMPPQLAGPDPFENF